MTQLERQPRDALRDAARDALKEAAPDRYSQFSNGIRPLRMLVRILVYKLVRIRVRMLVCMLLRMHSLLPESIFEVRILH